jgi:hypothetical protein
MKNAEIFTTSVTQIYADLVLHRVHSEYPQIKCSQGQIYYDEDNEQYVYVGFTEEELRIVKQAVHSLRS